MTVNDFTLLNEEQKAELLMYKGPLPEEPKDSERTYKLYFYNKFYFEEVLHKTNHTILETNAVQKFAHFKRYLMAIRAGNLQH